MIILKYISSYYSYYWTRIWLNSIVRHLPAWDADRTYLVNWDAWKLANVKVFSQPKNFKRHIPKNICRRAVVQGCLNPYLPSAVAPDYLLGVIAKCFIGDLLFVVENIKKFSNLRHSCFQKRGMLAWALKILYWISKKTLNSFSCPHSMVWSLWGLQH